MQRVTGGRFAPGTSGNPGGRPPVPDDIKAMFTSLAPDAVRALAEALIGDDPRLRLQAAQAILDRAFGKPTVSAHIENVQSGPDAHLAALIQMADQTRARIAAAVEIRPHDAY